MTPINYQRIVDELSKGIRPAAELTEYNWMTAKQFVVEFRTIGVHSARQTGKTEYQASLVDQGKAILVTYAACVNNALNRIRPDYAHRVLAYETLTPTMLEVFKNLGIKYVCLDESRNYPVSNEIYKKLLDVFGDEMLVIEV